jgi:hypothetical protein
LFAVEAGATVPFADDLPDISLIRQGVGTPDAMDPAFDLDDYVIDNDTSDDALSWSVSVEAGGPTVNVDVASLQLGLHEAEVLAHAPAGLWDATFTADDSSDTADTASTLKFSNFWLTEPKFTADNRLSFKGAGLPRFTFVKLFDGSGGPENTLPLSGYISTSDSVWFGPLTMYDLSSGAPVRVDQGQAVSYGGLDASVLTSTGRIVLTPSGALSCAVLISIPAVLQGSTFDRVGNWDGKVIMVAPAAKTDVFTGQAGTYGAGTLAQFCRFEDIPLAVPAEMQPGGAGSNADPTFIAGGWRMQSIRGAPLPTASLVSAGALAALGAGSPGDSAKQFAGATSGNVLKLAFSPNTEGMKANISTFKLSPLVPGTIYGFSMNVSTDIPASQIALYAQNIKFGAKAYTRRDEGFFAAAFFGNALGAGQQTVGLPVDGEWRQIYTEIRIPELCFALENSYIGGTGTSNVAYDGLLNFFQFLVNPDTPAFNVYIDNIYIYSKGMSVLNYADVNESSSTGLIEKGLANGVTAFTAYNALNPATNGKYTGNNFDLGVDLASNNWVEQALGGVSVPTPSGQFAISSPGRLMTDGCLRGTVVNGTPTGTLLTDGSRARTRPMGIRGKDSTDLDILDDAGNPVPDLAGEGYYGVSFWISSNADSCVNNPQIKVSLTEQRPATNQLASSTVLGPSNVPAQDDGWYQYSFVGAYPKLRGGSRPMQQANVIVDVSTKSGWKGATRGADAYVDTNAPGYLGDADVFVDDIVVHRVRDTEEYWNASLFE